MPIPNGDPLIVHAMMLQEERDIGVGQRGRFRFNVQGLHLEYGDSEFCLITGLKFGPFANLLAGTKNPKNSLLRSRLFPKQTDKSLRLRDIQDFILDSRFLDASDDDAVMLMQIFVLLRGMLGRELKSCIPPLVFELADHPYNWNRFGWGSYIWAYTKVQMRSIFKKQAEFIRDYAVTKSGKIMKYTVLGFMFPFKIWIWETFPESRRYTNYTDNEYPRMRAWRRKAVLQWDQILRIINLSIEGNNPRLVVANEIEANLPYYSGYLNWTVNNVDDSPMRDSSPEPQPQPQPQPEYSPGRQPPSWTGESSGSRSSSQQSIHLSTATPGHKKAKKGSKNPFRVLARAVKNLTTNVIEVSQKMDKIENRISSIEKTEKPKQDIEVDDYIYDNMDHIHERTPNRIYTKSPTKVVDIEDNTTKNASSPPQKRLKKPSRFYLSPNVQIDSTPQVKKRRAKKTISCTLPQKEESGDEENEEVSNMRLLLDVFGSTSGDFWRLWSTNIHELCVRHKYYPLPMDWNFWGTLLGIHASGWLEAQHVAIWTGCLMEARPKNARWTIFPQALTMDPTKEIYLRAVAAGHVNGPQWTAVDRVFFPINVVEKHWFLAELDLRTWKVNIYDSATSCNYFEQYKSDGSFTKFGQSILKELEEIYYWDTFDLSAKKTHTPEFVKPKNVPQQEKDTIRGDCGVFLCMFMEMLASNVPLKLNQSNRESAIMYRSRMANLIWEMR